jgi:hypothetical protein
MDVKCNYDKLPYHKHKATNINWAWSFNKCNVGMHLTCYPNPNPKTSQRAVGKQERTRRGLHTAGFRSQLRHFISFPSRADLCISEDAQDAMGI